MQKQLLEEMTKMPQTDELDIAGSDSSPSEDELSDEEQIKLFPIKSLTLKQKQLYWKLQQQQKKQLTQSIASKPSGQIPSQRSDTNNNLLPQSNLSMSTYEEKKIPGELKIRPNLRIQGNYIRKQMVRQLTLPRDQSPLVENKKSQSTILMVDKAVQTDEYIYKQESYQIYLPNKIGKLKKQQPDLQKDNFLCFTPKKSKLFKSSSHQSTVNFLIKNELPQYITNSNKVNDNQDRVDSLALVAPGLNQKRCRNNYLFSKNLAMNQKKSQGSKAVSQQRQPNTSITVLPNIKLYNK